MNKVFDYTIDGAPVSLDASTSPPLAYGKGEILSNAETDVTYGQEWYQAGYKVYPFLEEAEFFHLRAGVSDCVRKILSGLNVDTAGFQLNKYHRFVDSDEMHLNVVGKTGDLFPEDFSIPLAGFITRLGELLGFELTDADPESGRKVHIIVRINRPHSTDFNPPHKDIYEPWDDDKYLPKLVNFWIPICGVTSKSSLPLVPGSHLLQEDKLLRTTVGSEIEGNKYRVRCVVSWNGESNLRRVKIRDTELLVFTPHLIHGCAVNDQDDATRVALEFRLFKK